MSNSSDRVHQVLDGELPESQLSPQERLRLASLRAALDESLAEIREVEPPDLTSRVMASLPDRVPHAIPEKSPVASLGAALAWFIRPRRLEIAFRPAYAMLALVLLMAASSLWLVNRDVSGDMIVAERAPTATVYVQFRLDAPGASKVELAGSFTEWTAVVPLHETAHGVWSALVRLEPGVHDYSFIIDGETWVVDPAAPAVDDGFGGSNSRLFITAPDGNA